MLVPPPTNPVQFEERLLDFQVLSAMRVVRRKGGIGGSRILANLIVHLK